MKALSFLLLLSLVPVTASAAFREKATPASFASYVRSYPEPQLIETNSAGFDARLKLLDAAPKGAHARIATFEFLNGEAVRRLARHVCLAAGRGVRVELLTDSKNGDRAGVPDTFDTTDDSQVVEELYQYMANCGAEIEVYNHVESWISLFGMRLPNLFGDPRLDGKGVDPISLFTHVERLLGKLAAIANEELAREGVNADLKPVFRTSQKLGFELFQLVSVAQKADDDTEPSGFEGSVSHLQGLYEDLLDDPAWDAIPPAKLAPALARFRARLSTDPEVRGVYQVIRRYNRVQHRKLFAVESGADACLIIGGRNLGDAYLTDGPSSFLDGDVLLCRNHGADAARAVDEGIASFENLKSDRADRHLRSASDVVINLIPKNEGYAYRYLLFPASLAPKGLRTDPARTKIEPAKRTLLGERSWQNEAPVPGELSLGKGRNWHVLRSSWDPAEDQVRHALMSRIAAETKEIYLETPYAQFGPELRAAIEGALERGVRVRLVTNSFFVTDGLSKATRVLMADWVQQTEKKYWGRFSVLLTSFETRHMIHFKGAAFACQKDANGNTVRSYLLGSHNFHPRSGVSDKENSLSWEEPAACDGLSTDGAVKAREQFYETLARGFGHEVLANYPDLHAELEAATLEDGSDAPMRWISRALRRMFFIEGGSGYKIKNEARVRKVLDVVEKGGLSDLIGLLL